MGRSEREVLRLRASRLRGSPKTVTLNEYFRKPEDVSALVDHTLLKADATRDDITRICSEARDSKFASVCINPCWVKLAALLLAGSPVRVCTVVGFPLGANDSRTKVDEAKHVLSQGAQELDMVQNIGALRSGDVETIRYEFAELARVAHAGGAILKVIIETCLLTEEQKVTACRLAADAGADFVKTSTGFSTGGATVEDVALMRRTVGESVGVKASGGVRTLDAVYQMVAAGATRIGTSSGVSILRELKTTLSSAPDLTRAAGSRGHVGSY